MANWLKYYLSICTLLCMISCDRLSNETYHHLSPHEKRKLSADYVTYSNMFSEGSPEYMRTLEKAARINPKNEQAWIGLASAYLLAGEYKEWNKYSSIAVSLNPKATQAQRGHSKLFYLRDYGGALYDFDATDTLTLNKTDYVNLFRKQISVDYLRGLCYFGLKNNDMATTYFMRYINEENAKTGSKEIDPTAYLYLGKIENEKQNYKGAIDLLNKGIDPYTKMADIHYEKAYAHFMLGNIKQAADQNEIAETYFEEKQYHKSLLYEVLDQLYISDIEKLGAEIECFSGEAEVINSEGDLNNRQDVGTLH